MGFLAGGQTKLNRPIAIDSSLPGATLFYTRKLPGETEFIDKTVSVLCREITPSITVLAKNMRMIL